MHSYTLIENSLHRMGHDVPQHHQYMVQTMAPFIAVAAASALSRVRGAGT
jgi:hypothetical protein